mgnify:CR=1 FL=1
MHLDEKEFTELRIQRVREATSLYGMLEDAGHAPRFRDRSGQMKCAFGLSSHQREDTKPSARYYPAGERDDYETYYCWVCTERPLDAIHFYMRQRGLNFWEALRDLEYKHGIKYDDVELVKDISQELQDLAKKAQTVDPRLIFDYCEQLLLQNRDILGMKRYIALCNALDKVYHEHDEKFPVRSVQRLEKWKMSLSKVLEKVSSTSGADGALHPECGTPS